MTEVLTSGRAVNEIHGLDDEAFGPVVVASDPNVPDIDRRAALSDAVDAIKDPTAPGVDWAATQIVALQSQGLEPADPSSFDVIAGWTVHGDVGQPLVLSAVADPAEIPEEALPGMLAGLVAFEADGWFSEDWCPEHSLGDGPWDIVATQQQMTWLDDEDLAEDHEELVARSAELIDAWEAFADDYRLGDVILPWERVLPEIEPADQARLVDLLRGTWRGRVALARFLPGQPGEEAGTMLRELAWSGIPDARAGLVYHEADRRQVNPARALVALASEVDEPRYHRDLVAAILAPVDDPEDQPELDQVADDLVEVAGDSAVDEGLRSIIFSELLWQAGGMDLPDLSMFPGGLQNLIDKMGMGDMVQQQMGAMTQGSRREKLNALAADGLVPAMDPADWPSWFVGPAHQVPQVEGADQVTGEVAPESEVVAQPTADDDPEGLRQS